MTCYQSTFQILTYIRFFYCSQPRSSPLPIPSNINLEDDLQRLQDRGVLAPLNRMSISELLNPENETPVFLIPTAEEIFEAVNETDEPEPDDVEQDPVPTTQEALDSVSILLNYIEGSDCVSSPRIEASLQELCKSIRSVHFFGNKKQATLMDFNIISIPKASTSSCL